LRECVLDYFVFIVSISFAAFLFLYFVYDSIINK